MPPEKIKLFAIEKLNIKLSVVFATVRKLSFNIGGSVPAPVAQIPEKFLNVALTTQFP